MVPALGAEFRDPLRYRAHAPPQDLRDLALVYPPQARHQAEHVRVVGSPARPPTPAPPPPPRPPSRPRPPRWPAPPSPPSTPRREPAGRSASVSSAPPAASTRAADSA